MPDPIEREANPGYRDGIELAILGAGYPLPASMTAFVYNDLGITPKTNRYTTIPNHTGDMPEGTPKAILKQAGITTEAFLEK